MSHRRTDFYHFTTAFSYWTVSKNLSATLLCGKPDTLQRAAEDATTIEYALNFETEADDVHKIAVVHKSQPQSFEGTQKLQ